MITIKHEPKITHEISYDILCSDNDERFLSIHTERSKNPEDFHIRILRVQPVLSMVEIKTKEELSELITILTSIQNLPEIT